MSQSCGETWCITAPLKKGPKIALEDKVIHAPSLSVSPWNCPLVSPSPQLQSTFQQLGVGHFDPNIAPLSWSKPTQQNLYGSDLVAPPSLMGFSKRLIGSTYLVDSRVMFGVHSMYVADAMQRLVFCISTFR